jgi:putative DNA primase/helicase
VVAGNQTLARRADRKTLIETRGEGGYAIIAPSTGKVHETGKPYTLLNGSLATIPTITPGERADLFTLARTFNEFISQPQTERPRQEQSPAGNRPGDLFNARATWAEVLEPHGWGRVYEHNGEVYWRRPGKERGISATTNYQASGLLYVFSTSTPFEPERGYSKFSAYALLNHRSDFKKAAEVLTRAGYVAGTNAQRKATRAFRLRQQAEETARRILAKQRGEVAA